MSTDVDLRELAVDRSGTDTPRVGRRHVVTRYILPLVLLLGFIALMAWSARNMISRAAAQHGPFFQFSAGCTWGIHSSSAPERSISSRQICVILCKVRSPMGR